MINRFGLIVIFGGMSLNQKLYDLFLLLFEMLELTFQVRDHMFIEFSVLAKPRLMLCFLGGLNLSLLLRRLLTRDLKRLGFYLQTDYMFGILINL